MERLFDTIHYFPCLLSSSIAIYHAYANIIYVIDW